MREMKKSPGSKHTKNRSRNCYDDIHSTNWAQPYTQKEDARKM